MLKSVDFILAEDTRQTGKLLKHLDIQKKVYAHHKFNEQASTKGILDLLDQGNSCALVSDGGEPLHQRSRFYLAVHVLTRDCVLRLAWAYGFCASTHVIGSSNASICL